MDTENQNEHANDEFNSEKLDHDLSDDLLDSLLKDIVVPGDLKSRLKQIPLDDLLNGDAGRPNDVDTATVSLPDRVAKETTNFKTNPKAVGSNWLRIVVAASLFLAAVLGTAAWMRSSNKNSGGSMVTELQRLIPLESNLAQNINSDPIDSVPASEVDDLLATQTEQLKVLELERQIAQLDRQMNAINAQSGSMDRREMTSIILAVSGSAASYQTESTEHIVAEMKSVVRRYPNTRGAGIATQYINQQINNDQSN